MQPPAPPVLAYECEQAVLRFMAHSDMREYEAALTYFAQDGVLRRLGVDIVGHNGIREMARRKPDRVIRHVITNMRTDLIEDNQAVVHSYMTHYVHIHGDAVPPAPPLPLDGPASMGRYRDLMVREEGRWVIALHEPLHDFRREP